MSAARLPHLDYLRGLAASGIMFFHFISFGYGELSSQSTLGRIGLYGVSIFYVLSGLTLSHVYYNRISAAASLRIFFVKRIFRILPLFALVTLLTVILSKTSYSFYTILINITGIFGFIDYSNCIATGSWSIGNEWVFYAFFPILTISRKLPWAFWSLAAAILAVFLYFAFGMAPKAVNLGDFWNLYIHPFNQLFLFTSGILLHHLMRDLKFDKWICYSIILLSVLVFIYWPAMGDRLALVTGSTRCVLSLCCILTCAAVYKLSSVPGKVLHRILAWLGDCSYAIYLVHPIIWILLTGTFRYLGIEIPDFAKIILAVVCSLLVSSLAYVWYEKPFIRFGNRYASEKK